MGGGWALRVEERGRLPTSPRPPGRPEGVGTTNPGVPGAVRARGGQQLARPLVAWVAEMGSAGGGKSGPVCNVGSA